MLKASRRRWKLASGMLLVVAGVAGWKLIKVKPAQADRLESDSYVIQFGNFNIGAGQTEGSSYDVSYTLGQTGAGPFGQYGSSSYFVGSGFQYIYQIPTFSFSISKTSIELGELIADTHSSDSNVLTISTKGAGGYTIYAYELHPLRHSNGSATIVDTTCDAGACDETAAGVWTNENIGGFGFNVTGSDAAADFTDSTYFRQFADADNSETMQAIMSSANIASQTTGTVTYKVGVAANQAAGNYQTGIVYVAVPGY